MSRFSVEDIRQEVLAQGLVADISGTTIWRWLSQDARCPWRHRTWIFPRDPHFAQKAGPILDLYQGLWEGQPLGPGDFVLSADEKTSIQARRRIHASLPPAPGRPALVEHEYERRGAWAYLAAWDVHRAKIFGRCEASSSWGKRELNPNLSGNNGRFGAQGGPQAGNCREGGVLVVESLVLRRQPSTTKLYRRLALVNFGTASVTGATAIRNLGIPRP